MSPGDHLVSGLVPPALLGLAAWAHRRLRGWRRRALAPVFGVLGIAAGIEGYYYAPRGRAVGRRLHPACWPFRRPDAARPRRLHAGGERAATTADDPGDTRGVRCSPSRASSSPASRWSRATATSAPTSAGPSCRPTSSVSRMRT